MDQEMIAQIMEFEAAIEEIDDEISDLMVQIQVGNFEIFQAKHRLEKRQMRRKKLENMLKEYRNQNSDEGDDDLQNKV